MKCNKHINFHGELCPVCLMEERDALVIALDHEKMCMASCEADNKRLDSELQQAQNQLDDIEKYGTDEINEAVKLRQLLAQSRQREARLRSL